MNFIKRFAGKYAVIILIIGLYAVVGWRYLADGGISVILRRIGAMGFAVLGASIIAQVDSYDLSVGARVLSGCMLGVFLNAGLRWPVWLSLLVSLMFSLVLGAGYGLFFAVTDAPVIIFTFAMLPVLGGLSYGLGLLVENPVTAQWASVLWVLNLSPGGIPVSFLLFCVVLLLIAILNRTTTWGRALYAYGLNREKVARVGLNTDLLRIVAHIAGALMIFCSGLIYLAWYPLFSSTVFQGFGGFGYEVLCAVCLGRVYQGSGNVALGSFLGTFGLVLLNSLLIIYAQRFLEPTLILGVVTLVMLLLSARSREYKPLQRMRW